MSLCGERSPCESLDDHEMTDTVIDNRFSALIVIARDNNCRNFTYLYVVVKDTRRTTGYPSYSANTNRNHDTHYTMTYR